MDAERMAVQRAADTTGSRNRHGPQMGNLKHAANGAWSHTWPNPPAAMLGAAKVVDHYHYECWDAYGCGDAARCSECGHHNGQPMFCCRSDWEYTSKSPCKDV